MPETGIGAGAEAEARKRLRFKRGARVTRGPRAGGG